MEWLLDQLKQTFIEGSRWRYFAQGIGITLEVTVLALLLGVAIGVLVAVVRSAHDSQRGNRKGLGHVLLGILDWAYVAEIVRSGIMSIDLGQSEAGRSLGLTYVQTMGYIVIPQAIKNILPALGNELITLLKETSVCGFIGLTDLTKGAMIVQSRTYSAFVPYISLAVIYLVMVLALTGLLNLLERRLRASDRR